MASGLSTVLLDTGPLGLVVHPRAPAGFVAWFQALSDSGVSIVIPEICDYELRRELVRMRRDKSIRELDRYCAELLYLPITTPIMPNSGPRPPARPPHCFRRSP